jgi:hypothetical protein
MALLQASEVTPVDCKLHDGAHMLKLPQSMVTCGASEEIASTCVGMAEEGIGISIGSEGVQQLLLHALQQL